VGINWNFQSKIRPVSQSKVAQINYLHRILYSYIYLSCYIELTFVINFINFVNKSIVQSTQGNYHCVLRYNTYALPPRHHGGNYSMYHFFALRFFCRSVNLKGGTDISFFLLLLFSSYAFMLCSSLPFHDSHNGKRKERMCISTRDVRTLRPNPIKIN